ncbi:Hypothetical protein BN2458_PEG0939 [Helicobacter typhlonius]|uniref:Uncharacterized protein n=1 Tax=Helicobacter typhlonius TaxID=76936 RepID=A0A0S4PWV8_9HELI|nr:Hypothetical protein BN2458_PEG0939 [Helicobacter typhlonius]
MSFAIFILAFYSYMNLHSNTLSFRASVKISQFASLINPC